MIDYTRKINIYCFSSGREINFLSFVTSFTDQVTPSWSSQETFSRMDPVYTYKNTKRKINISFDVPSGDLLESKLNYEYMNIFLDSLYPIMQIGEGQINTENLSMVGAANVRASPVFRINFLNYMSTDYSSDNGLLGIIQDLTFKPELESGFFFEELGGETLIYPKLFKVSFVFDVLHELNEITNKDINNVTDIGRYSDIGDFKTVSEERQLMARTAQQEDDDYVQGQEPPPETADGKNAENAAQEADGNKKSSGNVPGKNTKKDSKSTRTSSGKKTSKAVEEAKRDRTQKRGKK